MRLEKVRLAAEPTFDADLKLGLGPNFEDGFLYNTADITRHDRTRLGFLPELSLKAGYQPFDWLRGSIGYDYAYFYNCARPAVITVFRWASSVGPTRSSSSLYLETTSSE